MTLHPNKGFLKLINKNLAEIWGETQKAKEMYLLANIQYINQDERNVFSITNQFLH